MEFRQVLTLGILVICLGLASALSTPQPPPRPALPKLPMALSADLWWQSDWQLLPQTRTDVRNLGDQPFNLQFAGSPRGLIEDLSGNGWRPQETVSGVGWLRLLSPSISLQQLPILPHSHDGHYESRTLVKNGQDARWVLRLWPSRYLLAPDGKTLWLGSITSQVRRQQLGLITYPDTEPDYQPAMEMLHRDLADSGLQSKTVRNNSLLLIR